MAQQILEGIRVLDLTRVLAGPWASQTLADMGAEVIKIERPGRGDDTRSWGPPFARDAEGSESSESAYFLSVNRGKKSVTIDITQPEGQDLVRRLAAQSDIVLENYKVGGLQRYGLDYQSLSATHPKLIYCSITGFGQTGPYKDRAGYDFMIQGMGGLMSITGERDDLPGGGPQKVGVAIADITTGLYSTIAILGALYHRAQTGEGQYIDMALLDCQVAMLGNMNLNYLVSGKAPGRMGNAHQNIVPYQVFPCRDGHLILAVGNDEQYARFCDEAGVAHLARDERFATNQARVRNRETLVPILQEVLMTRDRDDWLRVLDTLGIPSGPINNLEQVFAGPQVVARGLKLSLPHDQAGTVPGVANPIRMSGTPIQKQAAPPMLGQHTQEVLENLLRLPKSEIERLQNLKII
jgi:crotonobetainyl-CoA:carnitine CoA-transferase CaiB-like acyl-CoA transferase